MSEAHCNNLAQRKALGLVTHDNTGGPFVVECHGCGSVYPSFQCSGGGQIADTGDYDDARCPHCQHVDPEECGNVGLAWNTQQLKINALQLLLNERDEKNHSLEQRRQAEQAACQAAEQRIDDSIGGGCEWRQDGESGIWNSACGSTWSFHDDGPEENGMNFCHSCGKHLVVEAVEPEQDDDWRMNPCKQGHRDVGAASGVAHCYTCDEKIEAATTQEAFERWNATHPAAQP
ncbi:hypothetical protein [Pseudomonas thivervalensis]|uniref:hypothetical protein n=1 Tax=Pseudomonas thivervalensis TaxID=86265 RepID=UPI00069CD945|nr:hypothetical protein [Pseudomonas thivervalensis]